ncbi:hypothetical protein ANN_24293 [Periplaneta americana]|uniref:Uncharacterized protein n=1 Tax=Periplaneta americana TaxID=6978 RepID=A0ABQ8S2N9_PERAM|nr:hypothetical protein ANN_24293 [Periplaneta americana]
MIGSIVSWKIKENLRLNATKFAAYVREEFSKQVSLSTLHCPQSYSSPFGIRIFRPLLVVHKDWSTINRERKRQQKRERKYTRTYIIRGDVPICSSSWKRHYFHRPSSLAPSHVKTDSNATTVFRIPTRNTILRWVASFRTTGSTLKKKSPGRVYTCKCGNRHTSVIHRFEKVPLIITSQVDTVTCHYTHQMYKYSCNAGTTEKLSAYRQEDEMQLQYRIAMYLLQDTFSVSQTFRHSLYENQIIRQNLQIQSVFLCVFVGIQYPNPLYALPLYSVRRYADFPLNCSIGSEVSKPGHNTGSWEKLIN